MQTITTQVSVTAVAYYLELHDHQVAEPRDAQAADHLWGLEQVLRAALVRGQELDLGGSQDYTGYPVVERLFIAPARRTGAGDSERSSLLCRSHPCCTTGGCCSCSGR